MNRTLLLARTFFTRFFESDLMPPGLPQVQLVIWSMALMASPGITFSVAFATRYNLLSKVPEVFVRAMQFHRLIFITMTMTAAGLVALVIWDGVFPDRRDARILGALPLPGRVTIAARLLALTAVAAIVLTGVNAFPSIVYGSAVGAFGGAANVVLGALAHFVATSLAGLFVFTSLIAIQGAVLTVGGRRAADGLAVTFQIAFVVALLQLFFFLPRVGALLATGLQTPWLKALPSAWFLGLYDVLGGRPATGATDLAMIAVLATAASTIFAVTLCVLSHARLNRLALETQPSGRRRPRVVVWVANAMTRCLTPNVTSRAIFQFALRTLARSRSHRLLLSMYIGVALALVGSALVPLLLRRGFGAFDHPSLELLSAPLVISFFSIVGIRVALAIPVEPRANWVFRLGEPADRVHAVAGASAALTLVGILPSVILAEMMAGALWGWWAALVHATICALMGRLLAELLLLSLQKLPFTCTYLPGRSRVLMLWPLYLTGLSTYCYSVAAVQLRLFARPSAFVNTAAIILLAIAILTVRRRFTLRALTGFRFEEEDPDAAFAGFDLSEGFAAATDANRRLR